MRRVARRARLAIIVREMGQSIEQVLPSAFSAAIYENYVDNAPKQSWPTSRDADCAYLAVTAAASSAFCRSLPWELWRGRTGGNTLLAGIGPAMSRFTPAPHCSNTHGDLNEHDLRDGCGAVAEIASC